MASVIKFSKDLNKLYSSIDNAIASKSDIYKPIIGISAGIDDEKNGIGRSYVKSVLNAGGIPVILPVTDEPTAIQGILDKLDGIIMSGGGDIHPALFGEEPLPGLGNVSIERDISDLILLYLAVKKNIPVLGICRGIQLINVAFGGTLYQDLPSEYIKKLIMHNQTMPRDVKCHTIAIDSKSHLFDILKTENLAVNSFHHQSI